MYVVFIYIIIPASKTFTVKDREYLAWHHRTRNFPTTTTTPMYSRESAKNANKSPPKITQNAQSVVRHTQEIGLSCCVYRGGGGGGEIHIRETYRKTFTRVAIKFKRR